MDKMTMDVDVNFSLSEDERIQKMINAMAKLSKSLDDLSEDLKYVTEELKEFKKSTRKAIIKDNY